MTKLPNPNEVRIVGQQIFNEESRKVSADPQWERIKELLADTLRKVAEHPVYGGWEELYRDPHDGRYWERLYPHGELHGGGPPALLLISAEDAGEKYGIDDLVAPLRPVSAPNTEDAAIVCSKDGIQLLQDPSTGRLWVSCGDGIRLVSRTEAEDLFDDYPYA